MATPALLRLSGLLTLGVSLAGCVGGSPRGSDAAGPQFGSSVDAPSTWKWADKLRGNNSPSGGYAFADSSVQQTNWFTDLPVVRSINAAVKGSGTDSNVDVPPDATSLSNRAKPSAELYLAMGQLSEQAGNLDEAEQQYEHALRLSPKHADVLVAYARLKERQGDTDQAMRLLQQAADTRPDDAAILNSLGLCYAKQKMYQEATAALNRAIRLDPRQPLYRNNIATVLVDMGDLDGAYLHLAAVHGEAVACYNLGYLLNVKGQPDAAARLFAKAVEKNPNLVEARAWLDKLRMAAQPAQAAVPPQFAAPSSAEQIAAPYSGQAPRPFGRMPQVGAPPQGVVQTSPEYAGIPASPVPAWTAARPSGTYSAGPATY